MVTILYLIFDLLPFKFVFVDSNTGKYIIIAGTLLIVFGVIIYFFHDKLHWIGRLPGDVRIEKDNFKFYFPIATMILLSILVSLVVYVLKKRL